MTDKNYYRVMLGKGSDQFQEAFARNYICTGWFSGTDLTHHLPEEWRDFNNEFVPKYLVQHPEKSKIAAGLACGMLHTICRGITKGDVVLCPDGNGYYQCGVVQGDYYYEKNAHFPHRRPVKWLNTKIHRQEMSDSLRASTGSIGTVSKVTKHAEEIELFLSGKQVIKIVTNDEDIEDAASFVLEKHLEEFLVKNWDTVPLSKQYSIYTENNEVIGQQYQTDTGPVDILAISHDKKELVVIELKKGYVSDRTVGQIQRYMGYVKDQLLEENQTVKGIIIGFDDDIKIKRALSVAPDIEYYRYNITFSLEKAA